MTFLLLLQMISAILPMFKYEVNIKKQYIRYINTTNQTRHKNISVNTYPRIIYLTYVHILLLLHTHSIYNSDLSPPPPAPHLRPSRAALSPRFTWSLGSTAISSAAAPEGQLRARRSTSSRPPLSQQVDHRAQGSPSWDGMRWKILEDVCWWKCWWMTIWMYDLVCEILV